MSLDLRHAALALRQWTTRQWTVAFAAAVGSFLLIGLATVLIPNPVFGRDIAPVWWNYPVLVIASILMGMLAATYVKSGPTMSEKQDSCAVSPAAITTTTLDYTDAKDLLDPQRR